MPSFPTVPASERRSSAGGPSLQVDAPTAHLEEQRKIVTVLFADLSGSTPLAERLDPEELRAILARYFTALSRQIQRFGGSIDKYIGDAVMAVFGAPSSHEDDPERALLAALAMQAAIAHENELLERTYRVRLSLRVGVNTGEVVAGLLAGDVQSAYTVVGDVVNTAQRLESAAPLGQVLVSATTRAIVRHAFVFEEQPPLTLKGKAEPVIAYLVVRRAIDVIDPDLPPFVGRGAEVARLGAVLDEVRAGRGHAVHVHGEAGVGKSRLLQEFLAHLPPDVGLLRGRCASYETATPYALVADLLRRSFRMHPADDAVTARAAVAAGLERFAVPADEGTVGLILDVLGYEQLSPLDPQAKRRLLGSRLRVLLQHAAESPLVIVTEDLHWIDPASADVLGELIADLPVRRCLFVSTSRDERCAWSAEGVRLDSLEERWAAELIDRLADAPLAAQLRAIVLERTGGNPLFIQEVVRGLRRDGSTAIPTTVQEVLQARFDALTAGPRRVAQRGAVIGRVFSLALLARITGEQPLAPALATLEAELVIVPRGRAPDESYAFRHALTQEVIYQTQLLAQRRSVHRAVGMAIEELYADRLDEFIDLLAFHYGRSDDAERAFLWILRAGERAKRLFANREATQHFERAAELARADARRADRLPEILLELADLRELAGEYDAALAEYTQVRDLTNDARAWRGIASTLRKRGEYSRALAMLDEAFVKLAGTAQDLAPLWLERGWCTSVAGRFPEAVEVLQNGLRDAPGRRDATIGHMLLQLARAETVLGTPDAALQHGHEATAIFEELGDLRGLATALRIVGGTYYRLRVLDQSADALRRGLEIAERVGSAEEVGGNLINLGLAEFRRGRLDEAIELDRRAIAEFERIHHGAGRATAYANLAEKLMEHGDYPEALGWCDRALEVAREIGHTLTLADANRTLARIRLRLSDFAEAAARAEESAGLYERMGAGPSAVDALEVAAEAWEKAGDAERAQNASVRARSLAPVANA